MAAKNAFCQYYWGNFSDSTLIAILVSGRLYLYLYSPFHPTQFREGTNIDKLQVKN